MKVRFSMEATGRNQDVYDTIAARLARREKMVLATVISRSGSGPREPGAMMLIMGDGGTLGTVGGGLLEAAVLDRSRRVMQTGRSFCLTFLLTDRQASESGMTCGGRVEVLVEHLDGSDATAGEFWQRALKERDEGRKFWLIRSIRESGADAVDLRIGLLGGEHLYAGSLDASSFDLPSLREEGCRSEPVLIRRGDIRYYIQPGASRKTVLLFGAGHIAKELAPLCDLVGFRTVVIDDRPDYANEARYPEAAGIHVPASFTDAFAEIDIDQESFIVIVTRGHLHDRDVLARALGTAAGYIGMISSRRKRDIIYRSLLDEGFTERDLARVHSPIGIDIGARTPAEIAVSIIAEMIAVRAGRQSATK